MSQQLKPFPFDPRLESLRGLAALWVAFNHGIATFAAGGDGLIYTIVIKTTLILTPAGSVFFFFVLSGYVVGQGFLRSLDLPAYAIRRAFRLLPPFIASLLFALAVMMLFGPASRAPGLSSTYLDSFGINFGLQQLWDNLIFRNTLLNGPTWSIYPEVVGSAILPFLVLLHAWINPKWRWPVFLAVSALLTLSPVRYAIWFYVGFFAVGECAEIIGRRKILASIVFVVGVAALAHVSLAPVYYSAGTVIPSAIAAGLIIGAVVSHRDFMTWLEWPPVRFLGRVSFSFYLLHWPVFYLCSLPVVQRPDIFGTAFGANLVIMLMSVVATLALSALSYAWVERPFIALGRHLAGRMPRLTLQRSEAS